VGTARSICKIPAIVVVLILLVCAGLSAWELYSSFWPTVDTALKELARRYDAKLPEITMRSGKAEIRGQQPHFIVKDKSLVLVIDTREDRQKDASDYLKDVSDGAVLIRDSVVIKSKGQIQAIPLKWIPDFVFNSQNLKTLLNEYLPMVTRLLLLVLLLYFIVVKLLQAIIFALLTYFASRFYSVALTYGEAVKIAAVALVPPVVLDLLFYLLGIKLPNAFIIYFVLYVALLVLAVLDLARSKPLPMGPSTSINP